MEIGVVILILLILCFCNILPHGNGTSEENNANVIEVKGGPEDVAWVVQLSDLHFSVHHPERALDFQNMVGPALSMINPSLVVITGDLTDGKSKDLLTMKQDEQEWMEYLKVTEDVVQRSGLNKSIFYDLRGNHDNFGVPAIGGLHDFFSKYSFSGRLGRSGLVNSVTVEVGNRKLLFVGFDSTMTVGLRGPTNLFGHPTDQLLTEIDSELSQWDSQSAKSVTKISFGHFPISFSAASNSGKTLKDIFVKHSLSAYLCGHLHTKFGKNLKRQHGSNHHLFPQMYFQLDAHQTHSEGTKNCSDEAPSVGEFWEWEMGDWRKSRAMRILAVDRGHVSFVDFDLKSGAKRTILLPTFPPDSRFIPATSELLKYNCQSMDRSKYDNIRVLVFSASPVKSVVARIYDSSPGHLLEVVEAHMKKHWDGSRGDLYSAPWNFRAFEDSSPYRFWLQIEAIDIMGRSTLTDLIPFSVNGLRAKLSWTWKEFLVMGCQWATLYYPILWSFYFFMFSILVIPKAILTFSKKQYTYKNFIVNKGFMNGTAWAFAELYKVPLIWGFMLVYLFYLLLCPWLSGPVLTESGERGYMTYKGWVLKLNKTGKLDFLGFPDIMVVVLPHLFFVVLPAIFLCGGLAAENGMYEDHLLSLSAKKKDDNLLDSTQSIFRDRGKKSRPKFYVGGRWIRNILLLVCLAICWKHYKNTRALVKAYDMNPVIHFPIYSFSIPLMLAYTAYKTRNVQGALQ